MMENVIIVNGGGQQLILSSYRPTVEEIEQRNDFIGFQFACIDWISHRWLISLMLYIFHKIIQIVIQYTINWKSFSVNEMEFVWIYFWIMFLYAIILYTNTLMRRESTDIRNKIYIKLRMMMKFKQNSFTHWFCMWNSWWNDYLTVFRNHALEFIIPAHDTHLVKFLKIQHHIGMFIILLVNLICYMPF